MSGNPRIYLTISLIGLCMCTINSAGSIARYWTATVVTAVQFYNSQEMKPAQGGSDGTDGDGANTQKGLGVLTILILVTITIQLF